MGIHKIGFGQMDIIGNITQEQAEEIMRKLNNMWNTHNIEENDWGFHFEIEGDRGIDYQELKKLKNKMVSMGLEFRIEVREYAEAGCGYFFDTDVLQSSEQTLEARG